MLAMIEQSRAAFEQAGAETTRGLAERLDMAGQKIEMLAGRLATQDEASQALLGNLARQLAELDSQFGDARRERRGAERAAQRVADRRCAKPPARCSARSSSGQVAGRRPDRAHAGDERGARPRSPSSCATRCRRPWPGSRSRPSAPPLRRKRWSRKMEAMQAAAALAADSTAESEASIARQRESLDALLATLREGTRDAEEQVARARRRGRRGRRRCGAAGRGYRAGADRRAGPGPRGRGAGGEPRPRGDRGGDPGERRGAGRGEPRARSRER